MFTKRKINVFFILLAGFLFFSFQSDSYAASCNEIVGVWKWDNWDFTTFNSDGSIESDFADGQAGTWECENALLGIVKLKWDIDAFNSVSIYKNFSKISSIQLSSDGSSLTVEPNSDNNVIKSAEKIFTVVNPVEPKDNNIDTDNISIPVKNLPLPEEEISVGSCPGGNCSPMDTKNLDLGANPDLIYQNNPDQDGSFDRFLTLLKFPKTVFDSLIYSISNNDLKGTVLSLIFLVVCILIIVFLIKSLRDFFK